MAKTEVFGNIREFLVDVVKPVWEIEGRAGGGNVNL